MSTPLFYVLAPFGLAFALFVVFLIVSILLKDPARPFRMFGAPPLEGKEFADYRTAVAPSETIMGLGLAVRLPTGNYEKDKLLNLGSNRFTIRPQLGVVHNRGKWSMEVTASALLVLGGN